MEEIADSVKKKLHDLNNTGNEVKYDFNEIIKKVADFNLFIKISKEEMMKTSVGSILDFFNEFKQDLTTENKVVLCDKLMTHFIKEGHNKKSIIEALKLKLDNSGIDNELKLFIDMILEFISIDFKDLNEEVAKELFGDKLFDKYEKYKLDPKLLGGQKIEDRYFFNLSDKEDVEDQKQAIENYNKKLKELHPKYRTIAKEFEDNFKSLSSLLTEKEQSINKAERNKLRQPMKSRPKEIQLAENERHSLKQILSDFNRLSAEEAAKKELFELFTETPLNNMSKEKLTDISGLIIKIKNEEKKGFDSGNIEKTRLELKESELEVRLKLSEFDYSSRQDLEEQKELLNILNKSIDGYLVKLRKIPTTKKKTVFPFAARKESTDKNEKATNIFKDGANPFAAIQAKKSDEKEKNIATDDGKSKVIEIKPNLKNILSDAVDEIKTTNFSQYVTIYLNKKHPPLSIKKELFSDEKIKELESALKEKGEKQVTLNDNTILFINDGQDEKRKITEISLGLKIELPDIKEEFSKLSEFNNGVLKEYDQQLKVEKLKLEIDKKSEKLLKNPNVEKLKEFYNYLKSSNGIGLIDQFTRFEKFAKEQEYYGVRDKPLNKYGLLLTFEHNKQNYYVQLKGQHELYVAQSILDFQGNIDFPVEFAELDNLEDLSKQYVNLEQKEKILQEEGITNESEGYPLQVKEALKQKAEFDQICKKLSEDFKDFGTQLYIAGDTKVSDFKKIELILKQFNRFISTNKEVIKNLDSDLKTEQIESKFHFDESATYYENAVENLEKQNFKEQKFYNDTSKQENKKDLQQQLLTEIREKKSN